MEIGIGLDSTLGLTYAEFCEMAREAVQLGYESAWTHAGIGRDAFQVCGQWNATTRDLVQNGVSTGISVVPVPIWPAATLATAAAAMSELSHGKFVLGIGSGSIHSEAYRRSFGLEQVGPIRLMREYLVVLRRLLEGETVDFEGQAVTLRGVGLGAKPPNVPIHLGALGEQMLRLAGELSDGASLNWCSAEQVRWSRERVDEGARKAGRDPSEIILAQYIRICVDDDVDAARRGLARAISSYAMARPGVAKELGYRGHFARMGFHDELSDLEDRRAAGAPMDEIYERFPPKLLSTVGYFGPADGAAAAFAKLADGLDTAVVRVVAARQGLDSIRAVMQACRPEAVRAA